MLFNSQRLPPLLVGYDVIMVCNVMFFKRGVDSNFFSCGAGPP